MFFTGVYAAIWMEGVSLTHTSLSLFLSATKDDTHENLSVYSVRFLILSLTHIHSLSPVLVVMLRSKEFKTKRLVLMLILRFSLLSLASLSLSHCPLSGLSLTEDLCSLVQ